MTNLVDHLDRQAVVQLGVRDRPDRQRHRAGGGDLGEWDDAEEELLPLHPALLDLAEHVAADRAVHRAEHAVVLLLLHREVGAQDLLERILLGRLLERVVGRVLVDRLYEGGLPGELLDLLVSLRDAGTAQCGLLWWRRHEVACAIGPRSRTARTSADRWNPTTSRSVSSRCSRSLSKALRDIEMPTAPRKRRSWSSTGAARQQKS